MAKELRFEVEDEQYEWLRQIKEWRGYTWKGLMLEGVKRLDSSQPPNGR
jgi:hypothetical protein